MLLLYARVLAHVDEKVEACKGDARLLHIRGKDRAGFEINAKIKLTGSPCLCLCFFSFIRLSTGEVDGVSHSVMVQLEEVSETDIEDLEVHMIFLNSLS